MLRLFLFAFLATGFYCGLLSYASSTSPEARVAWACCAWVNAAGSFDNLRRFLIARTLQP